MPHTGFVKHTEELPVGPQELREFKKLVSHLTASKTQTVILGAPPQRALLGVFLRAEVLNGGTECRPGASSLSPA